MGRRGKLVSAAVVAIGLGGAALAQSAPHYRFDIKAQDLKFALRSVTREAGLQLFANAADLRGRHASELHADTTVQEALEQLLGGTGLHAEIKDKAVFIRGRPIGETVTEPDDKANNAIVVTGSHIAGSPPTSLVLKMTQQDMVNAGRTSLRDAIRDIPQNYGGGQNPGIGLGTTGSFDDSGASTINLRGLGGDATLTVLNGHRLPYNADSSTIDISDIPFEAIDRVEIVPDGASALYGSDAVAGVANIILKRDYEGITTSARVSTTSDGGGAQRQYDATAGTKWASGGLIASYDYERDFPIVGSDRSYSASSSPGLYLTPAQDHHSGLISAHQDLIEGVSFAIDGLYNTRRSRLDYSVDPNGDVLAAGGSTRSYDTSYTIAPSLSVTLPRGWKGSLSGVYGNDRDRYTSLNFSDGQSIYPFVATYVNRTEVVEFTANGPLANLGAGDIRAAIGGGYRYNHYEEASSAIAAQQSNYYAFGELSAPIISPNQHIPMVRSILFSAAVRYERYPNIASVASPKLGFVYSPARDFDLKGSWGTSFKAPTFDQRYIVSRVAIEPAAAYGGTGLPSSATILDLAGGNPALKPERATSWSITGSFHPAQIHGLSLDISYFHVDYRHRIVQPIVFEARALSNPIYANLVNRAPTSAEISEAISSGSLQNVVGGVFNPGNVVAIIDNRYLNAASQRIHGLDASLRYSIALKNGQSLDLYGDAAYLASREKLSTLQPAITLAGTIFHPPHYRAHGGISWSADPVTLTVTANYSGGLNDVRSTPTVSVGSMTTADAVLRYKIPRGRAIGAGWEILIAVDNMFNAKPPLIDDTQIYEQPYDASNYSPVGRVFSLRVSKSW